MRRARDLREHKDALRRKAVSERQSRLRRRAKDKAITIKKQREAIIERRQLKQLKGGSASRPLELDFQRFDNYACQIKTPITVCHVIESLGMGGGQTMMMELIRALDKYYPDHIKNIVCCPRPVHKKYEKSLFTSYGIAPSVMRDKEVTNYLVRNNVNIVIQHRLAVSKCLKHLMPSNIKYVIMNHTYHQLNRLTSFIKCDAYVSVCNYLNSQTRWSRGIHPSRIISILNGVENDYLADIEAADLEGEFKTGRCHRLVNSKFKGDSLTWMDEKVKKHIPGHRHYIMGHSIEAKRLCKKSSVCKYLGSVLKRNKKMSVLKALDVYFYETFGHEGASIAILESLACGVPVLCMDYGGTKELITNGVNGYIVDSRKAFLGKMKELQDKERLDALKLSTIEDFNKRLHVKHTATKYMQLFETLMA